MQLKIWSQEEYLLSELGQLSRSRREKATTNIATQAETTINDIFLELVRMRLRESARNAELERIKPDDFLQHTIDACLAELNERLNSDVRNTLSLDLLQITNNLRPLARELVKLSENLARSKRLEKAGERRQLPSRSTQHIQPVEIVEIGLQGAIEGLLVRPLGPQFTLYFDQLDDHYHRLGDWFPFEITKGDLLFVVDDDGSTFISTENFPPDLFKQALEELHELAQHLYSI